MIAKTAIIDPGAKIAEDVTIGHYSIVGPEVEIGPGCEIGYHTVLEGPMKIGARNRIFHHAYVGGMPQDISFQGERSVVEIGDDNVIREYVTVHRGTMKQNCVTRIGNHNLIMAYAHIAHDCQIGNNCIIANAVNMAGHVIVEDFAALGGMVAIHQFVRIGKYSFIGGFTAITQDVLPFSLIAGERGTLRGVNKVGLQRRGFDAAQRGKIHKAMRYIMNREFLTSTAIEKILEDFGDDPDILEIVNFIRSSERGVTL
ncbi:acyl-ACP--UDP-N-acetylglucosamine O-acyltransferase [bacterium]|nr:acyl-ACP--UDP-N-acetylglucosamine O-acyltransferase [candidate division CSSED10-310 bacterium]